MRIWMHGIIELVVVMAAFFGTGFVIIISGLESLIESLMGGTKFAILAAMLLVAPIIFGACYLAQVLIRKIPARCPECRGHTYAEGNRPVRYRCVDCGFVHVTWRSNHGMWSGRD